MSGELTAARAHPAVVAGLLIAEIAVTAAALVAIAYMLGWLPSRSPAPAAAGAAATEPSIPTHDVALAPGETLVAAPEKPLAASPAAPSPVIPKYSQQPERLPSPAPVTSTASATPAPEPARPAPSITRAAPVPSVTRAAPSTPAYARAAPPPVTSYERSARSLCINCGTVSSVRSTQGEWEVRVRFEDGSSETVRFPDRPRFRAGDRVRLEDDRLVAD